MSKSQEKDKANQVKRDAEAFVDKALPKVDSAANVPRIIENVPLGEAGAELLPTILNGLKGRQFKGVAVLVGVADGTVHMAVGVSPEFVGRFNAGKIVQQLASIVGGKGGGKADQARGAGKDASKVEAALKKAGTMLG